jgi:predicted DNA-binding protein (UPF0251 family)
MRRLVGLLWSATGFSAGDCQRVPILEELELADPASAEVFRLRFFLELSFDEIAAELKASRTSVFRRWMLARKTHGNSLGRLPTRIGSSTGSVANSVASRSPLT